MDFVISSAFGWFNLINPAGLPGKTLRGWQPLRYFSLSSNILASRVFFCTAIAENILKQNAMP